MTAGAGPRREPCEVCVSLAAVTPARTVELGRQRADGRFFCDQHRAKQPTPDPASTLDGLRQAGYLRSLRDTARAALEVHVAPSLLRDALEEAISGRVLEV